MSAIRKKLLNAVNPLLEIPNLEKRERDEGYKYVSAFILIEEIVQALWDEIPFPQTILGTIINNNKPALQMVDELGCIVPATDERRAWAKKYLRKCTEKPRLRHASSLRVNSGIGWFVEELMDEIYEGRQEADRTAEGGEIDKFYAEYESLKEQIDYWNRLPSPDVLNAAKREEILEPLKARFEAMDLKRRQMLGDPDADDAVTTTQAEKEPALRAQERVILEKIEKLEYDPKALPKSPNGRSGVKAEVRKALSGLPIFEKTTTFDKAWQRLRDFGEIAES